MLSLRWLVALECLLATDLMALDTQRCQGRVLKVGDWESQAEALCGAPYYVDEWTELSYREIDAQRSLRQAITWSDRYFDPGAGRILFRVRSRQGQIVAIDDLGRRGGPRRAGDCSLTALQKSQSVGEIVHRCGLPSQRLDLGQAIVDRDGLASQTQDLRHEQWLYPGPNGETLVIEVREGHLRGAAWR
ncbi:MAG: DUF2845 domain-containing protein [Dechloromonas sp.]|nr:DUF2845 domain-containing protein [Xanthomonadales bacterium]TXI77211.1 MAG: DUF2845 domain-containing protein [Dechloromonas sp.]HRD73547.1 DUF2845 domain-containing protein [Aquimonas sp.]HRF55082.1 DUF2845 domain-containing protein [Aquimonas sp.]